MGEIASSTHHLLAKLKMVEDICASNSISLHNKLIKLANLLHENDISLRLRTDLKALKVCGRGISAIRIDGLSSTSCR